MPEFSSFWQWLGWFLIVATICETFDQRHNGVIGRLLPDLWSRSRN